jgi:hypothetical protein
MECTNCKKDINTGRSIFNPQKVKVGESVGLYQKSDTICNDCLHLVWPSQIDVKFHYGVPQWAIDAIQNKETYRIIDQGFNRWNSHCTIHYFHRRETETISWQRQWKDYGDIFGEEPYSYRGWCSGNIIIVLVDETETPDSIRWITFHELVHLSCHDVPFVDNAWNKENKLEGRDTYEWKDDAGHEADSEEQFCNRVATAYCDGKLMGRFWWRPRVEAFLKGEPMPDPFAKIELPPAPESDATSETKNTDTM